MQLGVARNGTYMGGNNLNITALRPELSDRFADVHLV